ncbi:MAG: glycosyl hydrolase-related protein [Kiritimatiellaeota bacterium]|nr:glycosyl hydrolase-related protein [Kiritimatiellota bacterium]
MSAQYRKEKTVTAHVISHTHWDREWYFTFQAFRAQLIEMVDSLLGVFKDNPGFKFMLDGQTVALEDYLEIKPENKRVLKRYIRARRLLVGPWYVLPDEFLPDGESLIRNLLIGRQIAEQLGGVMKVGYIPDTFGHIAALPQIFSGFGIDNAVVWRGVTAGKTEFLWRAPDGTKVFCVWLPTGYGNVYCLANNPAEALKQILAAKANILARAPKANGPFLMMNGVDHLTPQGNVLQIIKGINRLSPQCQVKLSTLPDYIQAVRKEKPRLDEISGELIDAGHYFAHVSGVLSSRIYLKQANEEAEDMLRCYAEPLATSAFLLGMSYPSGLLRKAWKLLIQNHAHDSICGCSVDEVHRDMLQRFNHAGEISKHVIRRSFEHIWRKMDFARIKKDESPVLLFNPLNFVRTEVANMIIDLPPGSHRSLAVFDVEGKRLLSQAKYLGKNKKRCFYPGEVSRKIPTFRERDFWEIVFLAENIPALGCQSFIVAPADIDEGMKGPANIGQSENCLENEYLKLKVHHNGTLEVLDKQSGSRYENLHYFVDDGDAGDGYNYSPPFKDEVFTTKNENAEVCLIENGPVRATIKARIKIVLPAALSADRQGRSKKRCVCFISSFFTLHKAARRIDIETRVDNRVKDHRLRIAFRLGVRSRYSYAGAHFGVIKRKVTELDYPDFKKEADFGLHHQRYFVDFGEGRKRLAVCAKGLPQYQVVPDGTLYLTLLRSVGYLVREDLLSMKRKAGQSAIADWPTPDAQCQGALTFKYAIIPHAGNWEGIARDAFAYRASLLPYVGEETGNGMLPGQFSLATLTGTSVQVSAVKKSERGDFFVVRFYNLSPRKTLAKLKLNGMASVIKRLNFNEEPLKTAESCNSSFRLRPYEIKTVGIWIK